MYGDIVKIDGCRNKITRENINNIAHLMVNTGHPIARELAKRCHKVLGDVKNTILLRAVVIYYLSNSWVQNG